MSNSLVDSLREARTQPKADYRSILGNHGISSDVAGALLADGALGGRADLDFLRDRVSTKPDAKEQTLLSALEELETEQKQPKIWSASSRFRDPGFDSMHAIEDGDRVLKRGDGGALVGEAWDLLDKAGFAETKFGRDQRYGDAMAGKVREFQESQGLEPTGEIDRDTLAALRDPQKPEQRAARDVSAPVTRSITDWVVRDHEARSSIDQLSRFGQADLDRVAASMDPRLVSRMLGNLNEADRAQYQPTIERVIAAQNGRRESVSSTRTVAEEIRGDVTSWFGNTGVTQNEARTAVDRMSRLNDRDFRAVAEQLGPDALTSMLDNLSSNDRNLYAPTIDRLRDARNAPRGRLQ